MFVDGACEPAPEGRLNVGIGAVLIDPLDGFFEFFGCSVPDAVVELWRVGDKEQVIGQAELLPVLLGRATWATRMEGRDCITFIDNNSARFGLLRGFSQVCASAAIVDAFWLLDARLGVSSWLARVPSPSNIADGPSRLDFTESVSMGGRQVQPAMNGHLGDDALAEFAKPPYV